MTADSPQPLLTPAATAHALPFAELVEELRKVVLELDEGRITCPERLVVPMSRGGLMLSMPAVAQDIAVHKLVTVMPNNAGSGLPTIHGQVSVLDARTGRMHLMLDGPTLTGRRTAAMSMLGIGSLCPAMPRRVLIIGTGTQTLHHVDALAALYPAALVSVRGSSPDASERFCQQHRVVHAALTADDGSDTFDLVITCTTSPRPVYTGAARTGRLLIAVGAFRPEAAEIGAATVRSSRVFVDEASGAQHEAGDLLQAGIDWGGVSSIAQVLREGAPQDVPLLFKTVGCAAWDLAAARVALGQTRSFCRSITRDTMP